MTVIENGSTFGIYKYVGSRQDKTRKEILNLKLKFICSICGRQDSKYFKSVISNQSKKCSKCSLITLNDGDTFTKLTYVGEKRDFLRSDIVIFHCDCGRLKDIKLSSVLREKSTSCGNCETITLKKNDIIGNFIYAGDEIEIHPYSCVSLLLRCKCDRIFELSAKQINGYGKKAGQKTCNKCNLMHISYGDSFGNFVYVGNSVELKPSSSKKYFFRCKCGNVKLIEPQYITSGRVKTCGECFSVAKRWFESNKSKIKSISNPLNLPDGGPRFVKGFVNQSTPFESICPSCNNHYFPRLRDIKQGKSITCGCSNYKISSLTVILTNFLDNIDVESVTEYSIKGMKYDVFVPQINLLIELNGLKWHSMPLSKSRDLKKFSNAKDNGYDFVMFFEDEIVHGFNKVKQLILNKLSNSHIISLRPSKCEIRKILAKEANILYDEFHYIGSCRAKIHYGVFLEGKLIACMSFSSPTRQSIRYKWELIRMVSNPKFRIHGIWSKLFKLFRQEFEGSVVSFSDNRLFNGGVYEKLGFQFDGLVRPDYYWVKGNYRFHKSGLRKTTEETFSGKTENVLRIGQGYSKIWDLGKRRWILL